MSQMSGVRASVGAQGVEFTTSKKKLKTSRWPSWSKAAHSRCALERVARSNRVLDSYAPMVYLVNTSDFESEAPRSNRGRSFPLKFYLPDNVTVLFFWYESFMFDYEAN